MEPNYREPPTVQQRPAMPRGIKTLWLVGGILMVIAGVLLLFFVIRFGMSSNEIIKDLGGQQ